MSDESVSRVAVDNSAQFAQNGQFAASKRQFRVVLAMVCLVGLMTAIYSLARPVHDFVEYWTAAHLFASRQNPYSLGNVFRSEKALGFEQSIPIMLLSPPWVLPLIAPLDLAQSYSLGCFVWMTVLIAAVGLSSKLLMDTYFADLRIPEVSDTSFYRGLFGFTFYPVLLCLRYAQTAPAMLLGVAGFIYFERKERHWLAGIFLSLTLIKPQLFYLLWLSLVVRSWQKKQWKTLIAALAVTSVLSAAAIMVNPRIFQDYFQLTSGAYTQAYASGVMAGIRKPFGGVGTFWIQLVPPVVGLVWFASYFRRMKPTWSWTDGMPLLLTVSILTSAYGWLFDQTLLVVPVIAVCAQAARRIGAIPRKLVVIYTVVNIGLMLAMPFPTLNVLLAPGFLIYLMWRQARAIDATGKASRFELCGQA